MESIGLNTAKLLREIETCIKDDLAHLPLIHDLPLNSIYTLAALYEQDGQRVSDIAKSLNLATTSYTPTVDRLEQGGLVARSMHPTDRRSVIISLTEEGRKYQRAIQNAIGNAEVRYGGK